jgi:prepilin peptidase CpaA
LAVAAALGGLLLTAAVTDFRVRRIPNWTVIAIIVLFIPAIIFGALTPTVGSALAAAAIGFAVTFALYWFNIFGAGDAKLFSAAALFTGLAGLAQFALFTTLVGGLMAVGVLILRPRAVMRGMTKRGREEGKLRGIPYGVAIAAGAIITMALRHGPQIRGLLGV